ncbi:unnamed protein product [Rotaria sp. Silwood2]|nr:unnamed protein product [Rotaria sp. Silwood2]CAF2716539.1 unnamed protein product [Rotaria sp. Silwood2]CAF3126029.1 unnamed protein product [Rotaria sp. Silwood2]CAF3984902.1 unnamed protein product [Rotaria sp. Silwood2]CAF4057536.1 unnamed protein product [Rotaria sp. Silwood2]
MESNRASLKMTPVWFKLNDQQAVLKDIVYPSDTIGNQSFDTIAAYRTFTNKSKDFCQEPIDVAEDSIETLILVLNAFARKFDGDLTISMDDVPYDDSAHRLACGFPGRSVLQYVKPASYVYKWASSLSYFQLQLNDFAPEFNRDYEEAELFESEIRGGYPYCCPIGWYRHALKIDHKYPNDSAWLGCINGDGEWPVAFYGTHQKDIDGLIKKELLPATTKRDAAMKNVSLQLNGIEMNEPGLYLTTHCNDGAHPRFTEIFPVKTSNENTANYRVVFQCRVQPNMFTIQESPVEKGEMWRFADPNAIRSYGLLLKEEES